MHEWVVEGLPPKVLMHHKRMLGIEEEEGMKRDGKIMNRT
jgi:hypothetical protein